MPVYILQHNWMHHVNIAIASQAKEIHSKDYSLKMTP